MLENSREKEDLKEAQKAQSVVFERVSVTGSARPSIATASVSTEELQTPPSPLLN